MTSPDEISQRTASSGTTGTTRTPPPRTRRGAPRSRTTFAEVDALDEEVAADPAVGGANEGDDDPWLRAAEPEPTPAPDAPTTSGGDARGSSAFEEADDDAYSPDVTVLAAAAQTVDPYQDEVPFEGPAERPTRAKPIKRPERRFRQTVQKVDLWSVTKMALCFYVSAMGVVVVSLVALWVVADSAGIIDNVENFIGDLFSSDDFQFVSGQVLRGTVLVSVVLVALMVAFTIIAASFYNIFAELFGGVEVVIREEEQPPKR